MMTGLQEVTVDIFPAHNLNKTTCHLYTLFFIWIKQTRYRGIGRHWEVDFVTFNQSQGCRFLLSYLTLEKKANISQDA